MVAVVNPPSISLIFLSNEDWDSDRFVGSCSFEVDGWFSDDEWDSVND